LRDGLCYQPGVTSCWAVLHRQAGRLPPLAWLVHCLACGEVMRSPASASLSGTRCSRCGSSLLLEAERAQLNA
jgi:hypothetical protein